MLFFSPFYLTNAYIFIVFLEEIANDIGFVISIFEKSSGVTPTGIYKAPLKCLIFSPLRIDQEYRTTQS